MTDSEKPEEYRRGVRLSEVAPTAELAPEDWAESPRTGLGARFPSRNCGGLRCFASALEWMICGAGAVCAPAVIWPLGWAVAAGMLVGTALGWFNFRWLAASVNAIGDRIVKVKSQERGAAVVARGVGRIVLIVLVAYVIFAYSRAWLGGLSGRTCDACDCDDVRGRVRVRRQQPATILNRTTQDISNASTAFYRAPEPSVCRTGDCAAARAGNSSDTS